MTYYNNTNDTIDYFVVDLQMQQVHRRHMPPGNYINWDLTPDKHNATVELSHDLLIVIPRRNFDRLTKVTK